jgi:hypothetical protein
MTTHSPESCASCARTDCRISFVSRDIAPGQYQPLDGFN